LLKQIEISIDPKSELKRDLDLSDEMKEALDRVKKSLKSQKITIYRRDLFE